MLLATAASRSDAQQLPAGDWVVDPAASHVRVLVFRGGLLGKLGHNHVVSHHSLAGCARIGEPLSASRAALVLPAADFVVDDPDERRAAGDRFPVPVPAEDVEATRDNMLGPRLLDAAREPQVRIAATVAGGSPASLTLDLAIQIAGATQRVEFPAAVHASGDTLRASGRRTITHAELGLEPFTAALGALRVARELLLSYELTFVPAAGSDCESALAVVDDDGVALTDDRAE